LLLALVGTAPLPGQTTRPPLDPKAEANRVRNEFRYAWEAYKRYAWGHDELAPLSKAPHDWSSEPLYLTPVDALDTMILMGLGDEARETRLFLDEHLSFHKDISVKVFEITIRVLGGLLSSYEMTGDEHLLTLAEDLGNRLLPAFRSPTGMPYMYVNLKTGQATGADSNPAEIGTLLLEFGTLSRLTHRPVFHDTAKKALLELYRRRSALGLVGEGINVETGSWTSPKSHVGGRIDSYLEYLVKARVLLSDRDCGRMAKASLRSVNAYLADNSPGGLWYGEADMNTGRRTATTYGALQAFFPAVLALGGDLDRAKRLQESGFRMWTLHGAEPETIDYQTMAIVDDGYPLRPEIMESAYYLHHYTHDPRYLEMGRTFLDDLIRHCRVDAGYAGLTSVVTMEKSDRMHSFFLAETLKYLYLLFDPGALDFDKVVFNTEAHPLRRAFEKGR
jgi:hypothetical protein